MLIFLGSATPSQLIATDHMIHPPCEWGSVKSALLQESGIMTDIVSPVSVLAKQERKAVPVKNGAVNEKFKKGNRRLK